MSYDPRCHDLADLFLQDEPAATAADTEALAQQIQDTIETFLTYELPDLVRGRARASEEPPRMDPTPAADGCDGSELG